MTWTRISDTWSDDDKVLAVSRSARLLDIEAKVWCNRQTRDGALPRAMLRRITDEEDHEAAAAELVAAGMWEVTDEGWQVDWSDQLDAEEVLRGRAKNAEKSKRSRLHKSGDHSMCFPSYCKYAVTGHVTVTQPSHDGVTDHVPSLPTPSHPNPSSPFPSEGRGKGEREGARDVPPADAADRSAQEGNKPTWCDCGVTVTGRHADWCPRRRENTKREDVCEECNCPNGEGHYVTCSHHVPDLCEECGEIAPKTVHYGLRPCDNCGHKKENAA